MERSQRWRTNLHRIIYKNGGDNERTVLTVLILIGFFISGVLEHLTIYKGNIQPPKGLPPDLPKKGADVRRYCDPPNITTMYYDSSEETDVEDYELGQTLDPMFKVNLTGTERREMFLKQLKSLGMVVSYVFATQMTAKFGPKNVFGYSLLCMLLFSLIEPKEYVASAVGFFGGCLVPPFYLFSINWFALQKRSSFISLFSGKYLGYAFYEFLLQNQLQYNGINYTDFIIPIFALVYWTFWYFMVCNIPKKTEPSKGEEEEEAASSPPTEEPTNRCTPLLKMLGSRPVWMAAAAIFGCSCAEVTIHVAMPLYLKYVYYVSNYHLPEISFLLHFIFAIISGFLINYLLKINFVSVTSSRRMVVYVSHFIPAALLFVAGFLGCDVIAPILFYCLAGMATGANYAGAYSSPLDLAPKHAGIVVALCLTVSQAGAVVMLYLIPSVLTGLVFGSWRFVFSLTSLILLVSSIFFMLRGSGSIQPWSDPEQGKRLKGVNNQQPRPSVIAPLPKLRTKSIYSVEKKILRVLHVQEPEKFTRVRAYSTSLPNAGPLNVYRPSNKKRASIS